MVSVTTGAVVLFAGFSMGATPTAMANAIIIPFSLNRL